MDNLMSMANTTFEIQFPGDECPVAFLPGKGEDRIGAITADPEWSTQEDEDIFEEMYPRMRPGLVLAQVNGEDVIFLDYDSIMIMIEEAEQPRRFMFIERESKWKIVKRRLHFIATKLRKQSDGSTKAEREWKHQVHTNILHYAAKGDVKEFNFWMTRVSDLDFQDHTGSTALKYACEHGESKIVLNLLNRNADLYIGDKEGRTCLHAAVRRGHDHITKLLLKNKSAISGDLVNRGDHQNRGPIHEAAIGGNMRLMHRLLDAGAKFDVPESTWNFLPLHFAAANGHVEIVRWLIEYGGQNIHSETTEVREPMHFSYSNGWNDVTKLLQNQMLGEPIHCVLKTERYPWVAKHDSAMSPKARRGRDRLKKAKLSSKFHDDDNGAMYDSAGKLIVPEVRQCDRIYLGTWQCLNEWWLQSRGITAVITMFNINEFGEKTVKQRLAMKNSQTAKKNNLHCVSAATARAVRFAFKSLKSWKVQRNQTGKEGKEETEKEGKIGEEDEEDNDVLRIEHHHISVPSRYQSTKDWSHLLSSFPTFGKIFDPIVSSGDFPRVLVVSFDWQAGAAAICSWMMTRRGMDREDKGLPFFRNQESLRIIKDSLPEDAIPESSGIEKVLTRLQHGLDKRRQKKLNARVAELFKAI